MNLNKDTIYFSKLKPEAKIPSKRDEDGGYDLYACFDESYIELLPNEIKMIPAGIASAFDKTWRAVFQERGSTGIIGLKVNAGLVDSGYRNEWIALLNNTSKYKIVITKDVEKTETSKFKWYEFIKKLRLGYKGITYYPYSKAVCQFKIQEVPMVKIEEIDYEILRNVESERGMGRLGSSNK